MRKILIAVMAMVTMFWFTSTRTASTAPLPLEIRDGGKMYYDPNLNITWLTEPNLTLLDWSVAMSWAASLNVDGITGWTLSTTNQNGIIAFTDQGEMGYLYYDELGNPAHGPMTNYGPFTDLSTFAPYWTSTQAFDLPSYAWFFSFSDGGQSYGMKTGFPLFAMAVHEGDPAGVPEPTTMLLLGSGLIGLGVYGRKKFLKK